MNIYLDVCCLNRPFDDQSIHRVRLESEAVLSILETCLDTNELVGSDIIEFEINQTPDPDRKSHVNTLYSLHSLFAKTNQNVLDRAEHLRSIGLDSIDALHVASAEQHADVFLTTDDAIINIANKDKSDVQIAVDNPVDWYHRKLINEENKAD